MISLLLYYTLLLSFTFLIFKNAYDVWKINNDFTFPISTLIIFYFTFGGAYIFPLDSFLGFKGEVIGLHYLPIFDRLFVVNFDSDYFISCGYYAAFTLIFQYTYIFFLKRIIRIKKIDFNTPKKLPYEIVINPYIVLTISFVFISISAFIMRKEIHYAIAYEKSIYIITRANKNPYYTIHQLANEFCVLIPFFAYTMLVIKSNKFNIIVKNKKSAFYILIFTCLIASLYISFLGNRREILSGFVICILISLNQYKNINYKYYSYIILIVLAMFFGNNFFRSKIIPIQINSVLHLEKSGNMADEIIDNSGISGNGAIGSMFFSNELFYAHFSMYGVVHQKVPYTNGSSFNYLITSIIPRAIYPNRPNDIYKYYATAVHAAPGQIYTIHHATACYLNFGVFGLILGAVILSTLFLIAFYINYFEIKNENIFLILLKYLTPFLICGQLVTFITAGPEAYKSMVLEGIIIPITLLWFCSKKNILKEE